MKIKPLKSYKTPAYPTIQESAQDARLLQNLPRRWGRCNPLATLLGTGLMIQFASSARGDEAMPDAVANIQALPPKEGEQDAAQKIARAIPATRVAPILQEALANDGRGSFGCVAVSAPVFLSENEALDLIQAELEKVGLKLRDIVDVDGLQIPDPAEPRFNFSRDKEEVKKSRVKKLVEGSYAFDLGTEDKSVVVKFLQKEDFDLWKDSPHGYVSSVESFNFSWLASEVSEAFKQRTDGKPIIIGIFFEPSTYPEKKEREKRPEQGKVDLEKIREHVRADYETIRQETKERAKEKLRQQVQHFVKYLKEEGVI